jgi:hypothetical protein
MTLRPRRHQFIWNQRAWPVFFNGVRLLESLRGSHKRAGAKRALSKQFRAQVSYMRGKISRAEMNRRIETQRKHIAW